MNLLPETTINLLLSAFMGAISSIITIPVNAWLFWKLKQDEQNHQHKLDVIAKEKELILQHRLEMKRYQLIDYHTELNQLKESIQSIERRIEKLGKSEFE